jgi:hypothetical protein
MKDSNEPKSFDEANDKHNPVKKTYWDDTAIYYDEKMKTNTPTPSTDNGISLATLLKGIAIGLALFAFGVWLTLVEPLEFFFGPFELLIFVISLYGTTIIIIYALGEILQVLHDIRDKNKDK